MPLVDRIGHYLVNEERPLADYLVARVGLRPEEGERLVSFGAVYLNRQRVNSDQLVFPGDYIRVHTQPKRFPVENVDWRAAVLRAEDEFVVANKPAGIPVHATVDNRFENVLHQLSTTLGAPLLITQRLDTEASGLIVFAKTRDFQRQFNQLLAERKVKKRYCALVNGAPGAGRHVHYMRPTERGPKTVSTENHLGWLECVLSVVDVRPVGADVEVEINLETGRTHQIRAQLSAMGSPIVGDKLYGSQTNYEGIALCSVSVSWSDREGKEWSFTLSPPWQARAVQAAGVRQL